jgi:hypothetical protein
VSIDCTTDSSGVFQTFLPRPGEWDVGVACSAPRIERKVRGIDVKRRPRRDYAEVLIDLPDTNLTGSVVDEAGKPAPTAYVRCRPISTADDAVLVRCDDEGRFELCGFAPGTVELRAETREAKSDALVIGVNADTDSQPVRLILRSLREVIGRVVGPNGPVPGASVYMQPVGSVIGGGAQANTDAIGSYSLKLPRQSSEVFAWVMASSYAMTLARLPIPQDNDLLLTVDRVFSGAAVSYPPDQWPFVYLIHRGASEWFSPFLGWARRHGAEGRLDPGTAVIPRLEPGLWQFCLLEEGSPEWVGVRSWGQPAPGQCIERVLAPGQITSVDLMSFNSGSHAALKP